MLGPDTVLGPARAVVLVRRILLAARGRERAVLGPAKLLGPAWVLVWPRRELVVGAGERGVALASAELHWSILPVGGAGRLDEDEVACFDRFVVEVVQKLGDMLLFVADGVLHALLAVWVEVVLDHVLSTISARAVVKEGASSDW